MFNLFKKKPTGATTTLKLSGLHCASCALTIDDELESLPGVLESRTDYARQICVVTYDPLLTNPTNFTDPIQQLGYQVIR